MTQMFAQNHFYAKRRSEKSNRNAIGFRSTVYDDSRSASAADASGEIDDGASIPPAAVDLTESVVDKLTNFFEGLTYDQILSYHSDPGNSAQRAFLVTGVKKMQNDYPNLLSELEIPFGVKTQILARILGGSVDFKGGINYTGRWRAQVIVTLRHFTVRDRAPLAPYIAELGLEEEVPQPKYDYARARGAAEQQVEIEMVRAEAEEPEAKVEEEVKEEEDEGH